MGTYRSSHPMMSDANRTASIPRFAWFNPSSILSNPRNGYNNPLQTTHINSDVGHSAIPLQSVPFSPPNELPNDDHEVTVEQTKAKKPKTSKKAASLAPKPKQTKKEPKKSSKKTTTTSSAKLERKDLNFVTYEGNVDLSGVPTPFCSCTGVARQCYRWGSGGWQSSCCTTNVSEYPLPMSVTRPGSRMAGRKMSSGAYEKLLQRLAGDGRDLSEPVDLKLHWARHGTNKFVTIK